MKKNYTQIIVFLFGILSTFGQPVLNATDFTNYYDSDTYTLSDLPGLSAGNAGANQVWDFSGLTGLVFDGKFSSVPYASSPYVSTFNSANFTFKITNIDDLDPYYAYYKITSTSLETAGGADNTSSNLVVNPEIIFEFPYTFNKEITDTYQNQDDPTVYTITTTYDGYGTLITPYDTYTNVIRQKSVQIYDTNTSTNYSWYSTNPFKIIMGMGFITGSFTTNSVDVYTNFTSLGLNDLKTESVINLHPNPASTTLNIHLAKNQTIDKILITNVLGKIVLVQNKNTEIINVENLSSGLYLIEVHSGKEIFQTKFIKK